MPEQDESRVREMVTPVAAPKTIYSLQILRAVAALLVVCRHAAKDLTSDSYRAFAVGQCGVDIFFVISGIVIYMTARRLDWSGFVRRRLARIVPLYWLVTLITIAADWMRGNRNGYSLGNALYSFFFIPSHSSAGEVFPPIVVGWSLNFEMFFYLLCTLALMLAGGARLLRAMTGLLVGLSAAGLIARGLGVFSVNACPVAAFALPITLEFIAGMWLARAIAKGWVAPLWLAVTLIAGAILWLALAPISSPYDPWRPLSWGIPAVMIAAAMLGLDRHLPFRRWHLGLELGDSSYAIYLVHPVMLGILAMIAHRIAPDRPIAFFLVAVAASVLAGIVVHRRIEKPLLQVANQLLGLPARTSFAGAASAERAA